MTLKNTITVVLLAFVGGSITFLFVGQPRKGQAPENSVVPAGRTAAAPLQATTTAKQETAPQLIDQAASERAHKVVAFYFYTTQRCPTCLKIESFTQQAIEKAFAEPLASGRLEWKTVNTDEPQHAHFLQDYELYTKSVVLSKVSNGKQIEWTNLAKVWELVGNEEAFTRYIQDQVRSYLE